LALAVGALGVWAFETRTGASRTGASVSPAAVGIDQGAPVPRLDPTGDPAWVDVPIQAPAPSTARLPDALTAPPGPGPVITPADAGAILAATWQERAVALASGDARLFAAFETGPALEEDLGRCSCESNDPFGPITSSRLLVPRQTTWPAQFLAEAVTTASGSVWIEYLVFHRMSPAESWKVVLADGYQPVGPPALDLPAASPDGYDAAPSSTTDDPSSLPEALAGYWQSWKDTRRPSGQSVLSPGAWTTEWGAKLAQYGQGQINASNGLVGHYRYAADTTKDGIYRFAAAGYEIACGVVRVQKTWTPPPGDTIVQDSQRDQWGSTVAPGRYRAMIDTEITEPCFFIPTVGPVVVHGAVEYTDTTVAVP
jgi:hypothetical protein